MPLRPWQRHLMEQDLERSRLMTDLLKQDTVRVTFYPWSNEMGETTGDQPTTLDEFARKWAPYATTAVEMETIARQMREDLLHLPETGGHRQEDLNHLCRFVVAGLLMAFGQYGSVDAKARVREIWKDTERADG